MLASAKLLAPMVVIIVCAASFAGLRRPVSAADAPAAQAPEQAPERAAVQSPGQAALDKATEARISAESMKDLAEVVRLCREAIELGLDAPNEEFARKILAGSLLQRAELVSGEIFDRPTPSSNWPLFRNQALADLEDTINVDAARAETHYLIARLQALPGGDAARAAEAVTVAIERADKDPELKAKALLLRATLTKDQAARRADLDEALKLAPQSPDVLRSHGLYLLGQNEPQASLKYFDEAIAINADEPDAHEGRGMALFELKRYDEALQCFDKVVELRPSSPIIYMHRARIKAIKGQYAESISELNNALQLAPELEAARLLRARVYQQMGLVYKALADVGEVLEQDPHDLQALQLHAVLLAGSGKMIDAIDELENLRQKEPKDTELLLQLGMLYLTDQKPAKAIELFEVALKLDPKNWMGYRGRGDAYLAMSKQPQALADYEAALALDPENSGVLNNLAWLLATSPEGGLRNGVRAVELAKRACELTKFQQSHILSTLAAAYAETGDFKTAREWSAKAVEIGDERIKDQLRKELASYQEEKPWREASPPAIANITDDGDEAPRPQAVPDAEPATDAASKAPPTQR